jgi:hypothetical protein
LRLTRPSTSRSKKTLTRDPPGISRLCWTSYPETLEEILREFPVRALAMSSASGAIAPMIRATVPSDTPADKMLAVRWPATSLLVDA